jgi:hypothetical protein
MLPARLVVRLTLTIGATIEYSYPITDRVAGWGCMRLSDRFVSLFEAGIDFFVW